MKSAATRSYLFVPGNRPDRFDKACATGADAVIVDLEDAVPPEEKVWAREQLSEWLTPDKPVLVRINAAGTEWFGADAELSSQQGIAGLVLPKAEQVEDIRRLAQYADGDAPILPLIETAEGFWHAHAIARERPVRRLLFGAIDFQLDLGIGGDGDELLHFRSQLVLVSRLAGLEPPVDGVSVTIDDPERLRADVLRAHRLGFGGKLCIHPKQVGPINEGFRPSEEEIAWAHRALTAAEAARGAAVAVDGRMVDRPVIERARQILAQSRDHD